LSQNGWTNKEMTFGEVLNLYFDIHFIWALWL